MTRHSRAPTSCLRAVLLFVCSSTGIWWLLVLDTHRRGARRVFVPRTHKHTRKPGWNRTANTVSETAPPARAVHCANTITVGVTMCGIPYIVPNKAAARCSAPHRKYDSPHPSTHGLVEVACSPGQAAAPMAPNEAPTRLSAVASPMCPPQPHHHLAGRPQRGRKCGCAVVPGSRQLGAQTWVPSLCLRPTTSSCRMSASQPSREPTDGTVRPKSPWTNSLT